MSTMRNDPCILTPIVTSRNTKRYISFMLRKNYWLPNISVTNMCGTSIPKINFYSRNTHIVFIASRVVVFYRY